MDKEAAIFLYLRCFFFFFFFFTRLPAAWGVKVVLSPLVHVIASRDGTTCFSDDERPGQINNRGVFCRCYEDAGADAEVTSYIAAAFFVEGIGTS